jgi:hypothetical protein
MPVRGRLFWSIAATIPAFNIEIIRIEFLDLRRDAVHAVSAS